MNNHIIVELRGGPLDGTTHKVAGPVPIQLPIRVPLGDPIPVCNMRGVIDQLQFTEVLYLLDREHQYHNPYGRPIYRLDIRKEHEQAIEIENRVS